MATIYGGNNAVYLQNGFRGLRQRGAIADSKVVSVFDIFRVLKAETIPITSVTYGRH